jgi:hypothetical protein
MEIRVDGYRSTGEDWLLAQRISMSELPAITDEEAQVAGKLGISPEDYRRSKYAADLSRSALEQRASVVGRIVSDWLQEHHRPGKVVAVWLKTLEGKFRVEVADRTGSQLIFVQEELIDDLLECGSLEARDDLDRLLAANFGTKMDKRAS